MKARGDIKKIQVVPTVDDAAKEYSELKRQEKELAERISFLRPILEKHLEASPDHQAEFHGWLFSLVHQKSERIDVAMAKEKLDGRTLRSIMKFSEFTQIRTKYRGE